jgi:hypothetical protein
VSEKSKTDSFKPYGQPSDRPRLDEAVFAACGWPSALSDEEILERLLALNLERSRSRL